jgi:hypothetical protein
MPSQALPRSETERHIAELAVAFGWRHHRTRCSGLTREGFADGFPHDVLIRDGHLLFVFIARPSGALKGPEAAWAVDLEAITSAEVLIAGRDGLVPLSHRLATHHRLVVTGGLRSRATRSGGQGA